MPSSLSLALESRFSCQLFSRRRHRKVCREGWRRSLRLRGLPPEYTELPILIRRTRRGGAGGKPVLEIVRDEFCLTDWLYLNFIERKGSNNLNTSASTSGKNSQRPSWPCNVAESACTTVLYFCLPHRRPGSTRRSCWGTFSSCWGDF